MPRPQFGRGLTRIRYEPCPSSALHLAASGKPAGAPDRIALPVAGDDERAKRTAMRLVEELGFDAVDAGTLNDSWRQQPGTPVSGADLDAAGVRSGLQAATRR